MGKHSRGSTGMCDTWLSSNGAERNVQLLDLPGERIPLENGTVFILRERSIDMAVSSSQNKRHQECL